MLFMLLFCLILQDLVAIGYGKFSTNEECVGLICCWSLKNPEVNNYGVTHLATCSYIPLLSDLFLSVGGGGDVYIHYLHDLCTPQ